MTTTTTSNERAVSAFIAQIELLKSNLDRLAQKAEDHFDASPEEVNWGHVGDLEYYNETLKRITDVVFKEGEHKE